jgi:hypothetical protein
MRVYAGERACLRVARALSSALSSPLSYPECSGRDGSGQRRPSKRPKSRSNEKDLGGMLQRKRGQMCIAQQPQATCAQRACESGHHPRTRRQCAAPRPTGSWARNPCGSGRARARPVAVVRRRKPGSRPDAMPRCWICGVIAEMSMIVLTPRRFELGAGERKAQRDRIVMPRIAVEDDRSRHRASTASTSAAMGSDG